MLNLTFFAFLAFLFGFGFLVFIHELGHFLVAKWVGIRCTQFAIGFGPAVCSWRKGIGFRIGSTEQAYHDRAAAALLDRGPSGEEPTAEQLYAAADSLGLGETEYRLNYLPLGGYVKMLGQEDLDAGARSNDPRSFNSKSVGARFAVISAGVIMNMITGILFFIIAFMAGVEFPPPVVGGVEPGSPAATTYAVGHENDPAYRGLRVDDRVLEIDGERIRDSIEIRLASALAAEGDPLELLVQRPGVDGPLVFRVTPVKSPLDNLLSLGIEPPRDLVVDQVFEGTGVAQAGLKGDMRLVEVDGQAVASYGDYYRVITEKRGEPVTAVFADEERGTRVQAQLRAFPVLPRRDGLSASVGGFLRATRVEGVGKGSPAEAAGIQAGDLLAVVGPESWPTLERVPQLVAEAEGRPIEVTVQRDGKTVKIGSLTPKRDRLGIRIGTEGLPVIASAAPDTPAAELNLPPGSRILEIAGTAVEDWTHVARVLQTQAERALAEGQSSLNVPLRVEANVVGHPVEEVTLTLTEAQLQNLASIVWEPPPFEFTFGILREPVEAKTPWEATALGLQRTKQFVMQAYVMLLRLAQGTVKSEHLRGPVGIIDEGTKVARGGWSYLFYFLGLLSVNLAVINFLPIPIADGGHAVFLLAEKIKGSPVSARVQIAAMYVGLALIGGVFLLVTYQDIVRKIGELAG